MKSLEVWMLSAKLTQGLPAIDQELNGQRSML